MAERLGHLVASFGEEVTTTGDSVQRYPLGTLRLEESSTAGRGCEKYRYVYQNEATVTAAAGGIAYRGQTLGNIWEVGMDVSDVDSAFACGVYQSVLGDTKYGWVKVLGYEATLKKANGTRLNWRKGEYLYAAGNASQDGMAMNIDLGAANTQVTQTALERFLERQVGWAASTATSTATSGKAYIQFE